jgi:hypothetical protein
MFFLHCTHNTVEGSEKYNKYIYFKVYGMSTKYYGQLLLGVQSE